MGKRIDKKQAFLVEYKRLKASGKDFVFSVLALKYGFTRNQARGIVGGSQKKYNDGLLKKTDPYKIRKKRLRVPSEFADADKIKNAVETVESVTGSTVKAEVGHWVAQYVDAKPDEGTVILEPVEKTEDQKTIEFLRSHLKSYQDLADHRGAQLGQKNKRIEALEQKLGQIVFNQGLV